MTRRAAAAAARELLAQEVQDRAELVAALYDARLAVQAAEAAAATAQEQVRERRRSYAAAQLEPRRCTPRRCRETSRRGASRRGPRRRRHRWPATRRE
jgi:hypothetical protein